MSSKTKTVLMIILFALFIAAAVFAYRALSDKTAPPEEPDSSEKGMKGEEAERIKAPDFAVFDDEGNAVRLSEFYGKPVVLNFWASWCPPCRGEMPEFNEVYEESGGAITFMMVDLVDGHRETRESGAQYINDQGFSFPVYYDIEQQAAERYGVNSIPRTIFIDGEGYIVTTVERAIGKDALKQKINLIE